MTDWQLLEAAARAAGGHDWEWLTSHDGSVAGQAQVVTADDIIAPCSGAGGTELFCRYSDGD